MDGIPGWRVRVRRGERSTEEAARREWGLDAPVMVTEALDLEIDGSS